MNGQLGHAKAIGIIAAVCVAVALLLGMNIFFVLVLVYRAGWLNSLTSLAGTGVAAAVLAVAQVYVAGRALRARYPDASYAVMQYVGAHKLALLAAVAAALVALRFAVGAYVG